MTRTALARRLSHLQSQVPDGCPACRIPPPIVVLTEEDPDPPTACPECGRPFTGIRAVRIVRVDRGPQ